MSAGDEVRVVVVQAEGPRGLEAIRAAVGVVPFWFERGLHLAVVAKIALSTRGPGDDGAPFSAPPRPVPAALRLDEPGRFATDGADDLDYATDFAPRKPCVDVSMVGHARAAPGQAEVPVALRLVGPSGEPVVDRRVGVVRAGAPLAAPELGTTPRPGPRRVVHRDDPGDEMTSFDHCASGPATLRAPRGAVSAGGRLEVTGAGPTGHAVVALPDLVVVTTVDTLHGEEPVTMVVDTVWADLDTGRIELVHRGDLRLPGGSLGFVERVVVSVEHRHARRSPAQRLADTQRGTVGWAATEATGMAPEASAGDPILVAAKYRTWASLAPEPRLPLPLCARIGAELAEDPARRGDVLARHDLDEDRWVVEERAWLERMAQESMAGQQALAATYGALFEQEQAALAAPDEATVSLRRYAEVRAALEQASDPMEALEAVRWSLPRYARIEKRWLARAEADRAVAAELEAHLAELIATGSEQG